MAWVIDVGLKHVVLIIRLAELLLTLARRLFTALVRLTTLSLLWTMMLRGLRLCMMRLRALRCVPLFVCFVWTVLWIPALLKVRSGRLSLSTMQPATLIVSDIGCTL